MNHDHPNPANDMHEAEVAARDLPEQIERLRERVRQAKANLTAQTQDRREA